MPCPGPSAASQALAALSWACLRRQDPALLVTLASFLLAPGPPLALCAGPLQAHSARCPGCCSASLSHLVPRVPPQAVTGPHRSQTGVPIPRWRWETLHPPAPWDADPRGTCGGPQA